MAIQLIVVHMKKHQLQTKSDSVEIEPKGWSEPRLVRILFLSSDSMRSHPEIPHKPHLLNIWRPVSDAPLLRKMSQGEEETRGSRDETEAVVYGDTMEKWQRWEIYRLLICGEFVLRAHCLSMNSCFGDLFQMMIHTVISPCLTIMWLTRCFVVT